VLKPRWRKVLTDLWGNKVRTALVVFSIAIGVFAIGMIVGTRIMLLEDLGASYAATSPGSAVLLTGDLDVEFVQTVRRLRSVREAEGRRNVRMRMQSGPAEWKDMDVEVVADYEDMRLNKIRPVIGAWPPPEEAILIERSALDLAGAEVGGTIVVERADGKLRELLVAGLVHDLNREPATFSGRPVGFVTEDTLEWLGFARNFDELHILVAGDQLDKDHIEAVAKEVEDKVEKSGRVVFETFIPEPGEHPAQTIVDPMLAILGALGALSLFASSFLVINIISGLLSQQTKQIGVMKMVGAKRWQLVQMYLVAIIILGIIALLLAVPLGGLAAYSFTGYMASLINFDLTGYRLPLQSALVMVAVGLIVPLVAAMVPVYRGSQITVREALSEYGLGKGQFGGSMLDRAVSFVSGRVLDLSRPMQISLRNTVRRKSRLILTLITLTLAGAIFIGVLTVHASLLATLDDALEYFAYDVDLNFSRTYRIEELQSEAQMVAGVSDADSWLGTQAIRVRADESESERLNLLGTTAETNFISPIVLQGRWLAPDDANSVVLNTEVTKNEKDIEVGDIITLKIEGKEDEWEVVGLVKGLLTGPIAYANRPYLERKINSVGQAAGIQIITNQHDTAAQEEIARQLREHFEGAGFQVSTTSTTGQLRENIEFQFNLLVVFLAVMALLIAAVGGLGLTGTMSINVLERTREIGVMRALGASDGSVLRIVLVEGVFVGIISWLLGVALAYPIGRLLSDMVGNAFLQNPLVHVFAWNGALVWLVAVIAIAAAASLLPAWNAARLSVRQTLAYE
jgi:putative ABC transport system permease protein